MPQRRDARPACREEIAFQTKPEIALEQIRAACAAGLPRGVVLMDAGYGTDTESAHGDHRAGLTYVAGILPHTTVWPPGTAPLPPQALVGPRTAAHAAAPRCASISRSRSRRWRLACRQELGGRSTWREGTAEPLASRFARRAGARRASRLLSAPSRGPRNGC